MQTANILLALGGDSGNTVPKFGVTAAEVAVLRVIHGDDAVTDIEPAADVKRSNREELARLTEVYGKAQPNGTRTAPAVQQLFPGAAARVFESFEELDLPEEFYKAKARVAPAPKAEQKADDADGDLGKMTVSQLKAYAEGKSIDLGEATKKADIIAAIEAAEAEQGAGDDVGEDDGIGDINDGVGDQGSNNILE